MKNTTQLFGMQSRPLLSALCARPLVCIALMAVMVCSMLACDDGGNGGGRDDSNSASTVYLAGIYYNAATGEKSACYWKNGVRTNLSVPAGISGSRSFGIAVNPNGDVCVLGSYYILNGVDEYDDPTYTDTFCYWKNGVRTNLPVPAGAEGDADDIAVSSSGDVYVAGCYEDDNTRTACYWKNGVRTDLPVPATGRASYSYYIAVSSSGDVYISSSYMIPDGGYDDDGDPTYTETTCYWKNGVRTDLSVPAGADMDAEGFSIAISSSGDVYLAGGYWDWTSSPCYWKNGVRTDLPLPAGAKGVAGSEDGVGIAVSSKGDVSILGYYWIYDEDDDDYTWTDCYWKNGVRTDLPLPARAYMDDLCDMVVSSNGDVYISSSYYILNGVDEYDDPTYTHTPCYWKNGVRTDLPLPAGASYGDECSIAVSPNGDVYVFGNYETDDDDRACYWKNGVRTDAPKGSYYYAIAVR